MLSNRIIGFANTKGGVGKTTCSVHLAYWLHLNHQVVLVDADGQKSSTTWLADLEIPCFACTDPEDLQDLIPELAEKYDFVVVDGPAGLSAGEIAKAIYYSADIVLIPCKPSALDASATSLVLRQIRQAQRRTGLPRAALFINQAVKGTTLLKETQQYLASLDFPLLSSIIYHRQVIADSPGQGKTVWQLDSQIAKDFVRLFTEALEVGVEQKS